MFRLELQALARPGVSGFARVKTMVQPLRRVVRHRGGRYFGRYELPRLEWWADVLIERWKAGRDVFAYFNNDPEGMAVLNAGELKTLLDARSG